MNIIPKNDNEFVDEFTSCDKNSNDVEPQHKYNIEIPKSKKQEIIPPKMKYFKPLSVENSEFRLNVAKT
jgi:hypothetical protein